MLQGTELGRDRIDRHAPALARRRWQRTPSGLDHWLAGQGLALPEVETWAVHPGGPRILRAVLESAALQAAQIDLSTEVLSQFGNMSSATILFILERLRTRTGSGPCLALGPGLTVEAALLMRQECL